MAGLLPAELGKLCQNAMLLLKVSWSPGSSLKEAGKTASTSRDRLILSRGGSAKLVTGAVG